MEKIIIIAVANSHKAAIFKKGSDKNSPLNLVKEFEAELDENHEKPGRTFNSTGNLRHGIEPRTDRRDVEQQDFAKKVIQNVEAEKFDQLVIFAADKMLNLVENGFTKENSGKIKKKVNKNILDFKMAEMKEYILEHL